MILLRLLPVLLLAGASFAAAPASAGSYQGASHAGLPLDPELLPPNSAPGDCVVRRVTGPGGAYRWDRVECDADGGRANDDQRGYSGPLAIEARDGPPPEGDRYGERPRRQARLQHQRIRAYGDGHDGGRGGAVASYPPRYAYDYAAAGRDEAGFLIWPGKRP